MSIQISPGDLATFRSNVRVINSASDEELGIAVSRCLKPDALKVLFGYTNVLASHTHSKTPIDEPENMQIDALDEPVPKKSKFEQDILPTLEKTAHFGSVASCRPTMVRSSELKYEKRFSGMPLSQLIESHAALSAVERKCLAVTLSVRFDLGCLYMAASKLAPKKEMKEWFQVQFGVPYTTAYKYITFSKLIMTWPLLLQSGLTFTQLVLNNKNILEYHYEHTANKHA